MSESVMDRKLIKSIINRFDRNAFEAFFQKLFNDSDVYRGNIYRLPKIDDRIFECPAERFCQSADAFLMCYTPYNILEKFSIKDLDLTEVKHLASKYTSQIDVVKGKMSNSQKQRARKDFLPPDPLFLQLFPIHRRSLSLPKSSSAL